jgi:hypothetical protein
MLWFSYMRRTIDHHEKLDVAETEADIAELAERTRAFDIPGFASNPELGKFAVRDALDKEGWRITLRGASNSYRDSLTTRVLGKLNVVKLGKFHWDGVLAEESFTHHIGDQPYVALFATARYNPERRIHPELAEDDVVRRLWRDDIDPEVWQDVRVHEGQPNMPLVFRAGGSRPVGHDFQSVTLSPRFADTLTVRLPDESAAMAAEDAE